MSDEHIQELAALYALDGLEPDEAARVEAHLPSCAVCRQAVAEARQVAAALPAVLEIPPSSRVRAQLMQRVRAAPSTRRLVPRPRLAPVLATLALAAAMGLGAWNVTLQYRVQGLESRSATAEAQLQSQAALVALLTTPGLRVAALAPTGPGTAVPTGQVLYNAEAQQVLFVARDLAPLASGETYQLWLIGANGPVSMGFIQVDADGVGRALVQLAGPLEFSAAGISREKLPGSSSPTDVVMVGNF